MTSITLKYFPEGAVLNSTYIRELQLVLTDNILLEDFETLLNFCMSTFLALANGHMIAANISTLSLKTTSAENETGDYIAYLVELYVT